MVRTPSFQRFDPWSGNKDPHKLHSVVKKTKQNPKTEVEPLALPLWAGLAGD